MPEALDWGALRAAVRRRQLPGGGIAARADEPPDVFHTHFGIAALALAGDTGVGAIDPVYCLPPAALHSFLAVG